VEITRRFSAETGAFAVARLIRIFPIPGDARNPHASNSYLAMPTALAVGSLAHGQLQAHGDGGMQGWQGEALEPAPLPSGSAYRPPSLGVVDLLDHEVLKAWAHVEK